VLGTQTKCNDSAGVTDQRRNFLLTPSYTAGNSKATQEKSGRSTRKF